MIEIRIHGRGGQGAVTASEVLAIAAFHNNHFSQAFPRFGPERTGAPVEAYCRIDNTFIRTRAQIYKPDYLIILDSTLLDAVDVTSGLKEGGVIVINSSDDEIKKRFPNYHVFVVDATKIALDTLGRPIVNTAILGGFIAATSLLPLASLEATLAERFSGEILEKNIHAIRKAYEFIRKGE